MMNKRGDVGDFIVLIVITLIAALSIYAGVIAWNKISPKLAEMPGVSEDPQIANLTEEVIIKVQAGINIFDILFLMFFFGTYFAILASVFYLDSHPGFLLFALILFGVVIFIGGVVSDLFMTIAGTDQFVEAQATHPIIYHIMQFLPIYLIPMGIIFLIILYASRSGGGPV